MSTDRSARPIRQLADLRPDPSNPNRGNARGRQLLATSLKTCGAGRSIVADKQGTVVAGNQTLQAA